MLLVNRNLWIVAVAVVMSLMTALAQSSTDAPLPPNSLYNLQVSLEDQSGEMAGLDQYRGRPVLVTMFYASCPHVCPLLISTIRQMESKLSTEELSELRVLAAQIVRHVSVRRSWRTGHSPGTPMKLPTALRWPL